MNILITGAAGFIGQLLAKELLNDPAHKIILVDIVDPPVPAGVKYPQNAKTIKTDLVEGDIESLVAESAPDAVYAFHGIMSSGSEANFELGMKANVDATRALLETLRRKASVPGGVRFIYSSSQAVYGQPLPRVVTDDVIPTPESSYGAAKIICETLVNDYTRRGFITGFTLRFPTISVRPGKPTAAASSFLSGMIREPLNGQEAIIPLEDRSFESWLCSPRTLVRNLIVTLSLPADCVPPHIRQINVPGICVTIQDMMDALEKVGGKDKLVLLKEQEDPVIKKIVHSWPTRFDNSQAIKLGFHRDESFEQAVRDFKESLES
jgi:nucleoside-diphosphate-sugar epimerase